MPEEIKNPNNKVERSYEGKYYAFWRGHIVYEHQKTRVRRFETERAAWEYLALCDALDKLA
ncbi:MAG: hypothetical protein WBW99_07335 [Pseudolabrys sp.]